MRDEARKRRNRRTALAAALAAVGALLAARLIAPPHGALVRLDDQPPERVPTLEIVLAVNKTDSGASPQQPHSAVLEAGVDVRSPGRYLLWVDGHGPRTLAIDSR